MKTRFLTMLLSVLLITSVCLASAPSTPAEQKIAAANATIQADPKNFQAFNALGLALAQRARETADMDFYDQAEEALQESLRLSPDNLEALKYQVWVMLGKHEFSQALEAAKAINHKNPDDLMVYGFLVDANVELGNYKEAEQAAQWMLDIRPYNIPALTRTAYLRELFGDIDGAIELMMAAYQRIASTETEDRAWVLNQLAHLHLIQGQPDVAAQLLEQALELFPDYHYALANLAQARTDQGKLQEAADLYKMHYDLAPHPENLYYYAMALDRLGHHEEALATYQEFEQAAAGESANQDNCNRDLIFYYVDQASKPAEALKIAQIEISHRQDVHTLDAYAWALYANGQYQEAQKHITTALAVGIRDARMFYHAGCIAAKLGDKAEAQKYFQLAIDLNPPSQWANAARESIKNISNT